MYKKNCVIILCQLKWDFLNTQEQVDGAFWNAHASRQRAAGRWQSCSPRGWPWSGEAASSAGALSALSQLSDQHSKHKTLVH